MFTDPNGQSPTNDDVNAIMRQVVYANSNDTPPASIQINWTFDDGNDGVGQGSGGALQAVGATTVALTSANDNPVITSDGGGVIVDVGGGETALRVAVNENQTGVIRISATDADADATRTYSLLQQLLEHEIMDLDASFELNVVELSQSIELRDAIVKLRGQIDQMLNEDVGSSPLSTFSPSVVGASLTAGVVTWVLRSGLLISATITATPLWRPLDPIAILAQSDEDVPLYEKGKQVDSRYRTTSANDQGSADPDVKHG